LRPAWDAVLPAFRAGSSAMGKGFDKNFQE
jgi:hypothetical protein